MTTPIRRWATLLVLALVPACSDNAATPAGTTDAAVELPRPADSPAAPASPGCEGLADGTPCDDGDACTVDDSCDSQRCVGGASTVCEAADPCQPALCDSDLGCVTQQAPDGISCVLPCFGIATCKGGVCSADVQSKLACPPPDEPCLERLECDIGTGECSVAILKVAGGSCNADNDVCTFEVCDASGGCQPTGQHETCQWQTSNDPCWTYACGPATGCAKQVFVEGASCKDENPCTESDQCAQVDGAYVCVGQPVGVDDANPCTDDSCVGGKVVHTLLDGAACAPDHSCAKVGQCASGVCVANDPACACDADSDCDDGDACTADGCAGDQQCALLPVSCDDGDACTTDGCDPASGCTYELVGDPDATESCNGVDDDCDGLVDEDFGPVGAPCDGGDPDACAQGAWACAPGGQSAVCEGDESAGVEVCNGDDDDCDGAVDEGFAGLGEPCDGGDTDSCAFGVMVCAPDGLSVHCGTESTTDLVELCNGVDDDCDGEVDEDFPALGTPCDSNDGDECATGLFACGPGELSVICQGEVVTDLQETCNGKDDDCDGDVDEGFDVGAPCDGPDSDACANGVWVCAAGGLGVECGPESVVDLVEACNGADDDCDGEVDDGFFGLGEACDGSDDDLCADGLRVCAPGGAEAVCEEPGGPGHVEQCNGVDDDCDGLIDEVFAGLGEPCDGPDADACATGWKVCTPGGDGVVCEEPGPANVELCNGTDDDCDGAIDEGFGVGQACDGPDSDSCPNGAFVCAADGADTECAGEPDPPIVEVCNDADDDCDGAVDEGFDGLGDPCDGPDLDACATGVWTCNAAGDGVTCVEASVDRVELCNGQDDDCDSATDEDFTELGDACDGPDGDLCENGVVVCAADGFGTECGPESSEGLVEACNGVDDDCDSMVDEDFPAKGAACDGDDGDDCADGVWECNAAQDGLVCTDDGAAHAEACNGVDDDCDGEVDEDFPGLGQACDGDDADLCKNGVTACKSDGSAAECAGEGDAGGAELCNLKDDDCDGEVDEGFDTLGAACDSDDADECADDVVACAPSGLTTVCEDQGPALAELCNGQDDDCDGAKDEDFPDLGQPCDSGADADLCVDDVRVCVPDGGGTTCQDQGGALSEVCNGLDDDCDGDTDEPWPTLGQPCDGDDEDHCKGGALVCNAAKTSLICNDDPQSVPELCNGKDDDCDGQADELWPTLGEACDGADADQCADGVVVCAPGQAGTMCSDDPASHTELCNSKDDDCDGQVDEGFSPGTACDSPVDSDLCQDDVLACTADGLDTGCKDQGGSITETCNGVDDDCDGEVDEDWPTKGKACDGADADACADGTWSCAAGGDELVCSDDSSSKTELCNGQDDDCDGEVDEAWPKLGTPCDGSDSDLCADGTWICKDNGWGLKCTDDWVSSTESCNDEDDDCDGEVDESWPLLGAPCDGADADKCKDGLYACNGSGTGLTCTDDAAAVAETCNGMDDDCDGVVDPVGTGGCKSYYQDTDKDGWGAGTPKCLCGPSATYKVAVGGDCVDFNPWIHPGVALCDHDGDCDGALLDVGEACDDGNTDPYDGRDACAVVPFRINAGGEAHHTYPDALLVGTTSLAAVWTAKNTIEARLLPLGAPASTTDQPVYTPAFPSLGQPVRLVPLGAAAFAAVFVERTWEEAPLDGNRLSAQALGPDLSPAGAPCELWAGTASVWIADYDVARVAKSMAAVAWTSRIGSSAATSFRLFGPSCSNLSATYSSQMYSGGGQVELEARPGAVGAAMAAYNKNGSIFLLGFAATGQPTLAGTLNEPSDYLSLAARPDGYWVFYAKGNWSQPSLRWVDLMAEAAGPPVSALTAGPYWSRSPAAAALPGGGVVLVVERYHSQAQTTGGIEVWRHDSQGAVVGDMVFLSVDEARAFGPQVTATPDGELIVVWYQLMADGGHDIFGQRFAADGTIAYR